MLQKVLPKISIWIEKKTCGEFIHFSSKYNVFILCILVFTSFAVTMVLTALIDITIIKATKNNKNISKQIQIWSK